MQNDMFWLEPQKEWYMQYCYVIIMIMASQIMLVFCSVRRSL